MFSLEILFLGSALAIDAAVVTFAIGLLSVHLPKRVRLKRALISALTFGLFQFLMMWLGSYGGYLFSFSKFGYLSQFIIGGIFLIIAIKLIQESMEIQERQLEWRITPMIALAMITSIDALASGVSLGTLPKAYLAAMEVGLITFVVCLFFYLISQFFQRIPDRWLLRLAALIFMGLGGDILVGLFGKGLI